MTGICKPPERRNMLLAKKLWRRREGCDGSDIPDNDIAGSALRKAAIKLKALLADGAVPAPRSRLSEAET